MLVANALRVSQLGKLRNIKARKKAGDNLVAVINELGFLFVPIFCNFMSSAWLRNENLFALICCQFSTNQETAPQQLRNVDTTNNKRALKQQSADRNQTWQLFC